jgi:pimeloyl-ACP methyl ester carboxylesterase
VQKLLKAGLRLLSAVAPGAAAKIGARLWFGVRRPRISEETARFLATGVRFDVRVDEINVVAWQWGSGPTVLLVHGWGGYAGQLEAFVQPLVQGGHEVIAFDAPSHGASGPGKLGQGRATLFDFSSAMVAVSRERALAGVIAHSGGCAAAAWALTTNTKWCPQRMVFFAPFGSAARYMDAFQRALGLSDEAMRRFRADTERQFNFRWADFEVPAITDRVSTPPVLVVHDRGDRETSWEDGAAIAARWPEARLVTTTGLGHNRILRDAGMVEAAVEFIGARGRTPLE